MARYKMIRKYMGIPALAAALVIVSALTVCGNGTGGVHADGDPVSGTEQSAAPREQRTGQIYLYGESHAQEKIMDKEAELWYQYYHEEGLRHLFVEYPYYTAEFLNLWMQSDSDEILDAVYDDWKGSAAHNPHIKDFYQRIKRECPETVFHGTDVGHQYNTTGKRYLDYLRENHLENSRQYRIAEEAVEQGKYYYEHSADAYRENKMAENFVREFEALGGESVMGIYGSAHIGIDAMDYNTGSVPSMANQIHSSYQDALHTEDLRWVTKEIEPEQMETIAVAGKKYQAAYFGKEDLTGFRDYSYREFWRLEHAYDDFRNCPKTGDVLPYGNYPMLIETEQVFVVDYGKTDGSVTRMYFRSDGNDWEGFLTTEEIRVE